MAWTTGTPAVDLRPVKIRQYCPAIAADTVNWSDAQLIIWWNSAFSEIQSKLVPPFDPAGFAALNTADGNSAAGNELIAQVAAYLIYRQLPSRITATVDDMRAIIYGRDTAMGRDTGLFEELQNGDRTLLDNTGVPVSRTCLLGSTTSGTARTFSLDTRDESRTVTADGTLSQLSPNLEP